MNPEHVLHPNYMGGYLKNTGVESISANYGAGMQELKKKASKESDAELHKMRVRKAREFGVPMHEVGF
jgi:hypothetical protein